MRRLNWHRNNREHIFEGRNRITFSGIQPANEGVAKRFFHHFKTTAVKAMLGLAVATATLCSCSSEKKQIEIVKTNEEVVTKSSITDENGRAVFKVDGKTFVLNVYDSEKLEPVHGLIVILSTKGDEGIYILLDPENRYFPRITDSGKYEQAKSFLKSDGVTDEFKVKNVVKEKKRTLCSPLFKNALQDKTPAAIFNNKKWLQDNFGDPVKTKIPLKELNDVLGQLIKFAVGEGIEGKITEAAVKLGTKFIDTTGKKLIPIVGYALTAIDLCSILETHDWGAYYRSLCYEENDTFSIYRLKGLNDLKIDVGPVSLGVETPLFIVLPEKDNPNWLAPTAVIDGKVKVVEGSFNPLTKNVYLRHVDGKIPTIWYPVWYDVVKGYGEFSFVASACENYNPTYDLKVATGWSGKNPKTTMKVKETKKDDKPYNVEFYIDCGCNEEDYKTFYADRDGDGFGDEKDIIVACQIIENTVDNNNDIDDNNASINPNAVEECDGIDNNGDGKIDDIEKKIVLCGNGRGSKTIECKDGVLVESACTIEGCLEIPDTAIGFYSALDLPQGLKLYDIENDVIAYEQESGMISGVEIVVLDLKSGKRSTIAGSGGPMISGNHIAFYKGIITGNNEGEGLGLYDINSGEVKVIPLSYYVPYAYEIVAIGGGKLIFWESVFFNLYDIGTGEIKRINPLQFYFHNHMAMSDFGIATSATILAIHNFDENSKWEIVPGTEYLGSISMHDENVAFYQNNNIHVYNVLTKNIEQITNNIASGGAYSDYPDMHKTKVAYFERSSFSKENIVVTDIATGWTKYLTSNEDTGRKLPPKIYENKVIFASWPQEADNTPGRVRLLLCTFSE